MYNVHATVIYFLSFLVFDWGDNAKYDGDGEDKDYYTTELFPNLDCRSHRKKSGKNSLFPNITALPLTVLDNWQRKDQFLCCQCGFLE